MATKELYKLAALEEIKDRIISLQEDYELKRDEYDYYEEHTLAEGYHEKELVCGQMVNLIQAVIDTIKGA